MATVKSLETQNPYAALLNRLSQREINQLSRSLALQLRKSQASRIKAQKNPDGSAFEKRSDKSPKKGRMFKKLMQTKHLRQTSLRRTPTIYFARASHIARIHQYGLKGVVNDHVTTQYFTRALLGFSNADEAMIADKTLSFIAEAFK